MAKTRKKSSSNGSKRPPLLVQRLCLPEGLRRMEHPRCSYNKVPAAQYSMHPRGRRCNHNALFAVDEVALCQLHAGRACLKYMLGEDDNDNDNE